MKRDGCRFSRRVYGLQGSNTVFLVIKTLQIIRFSVLFPLRPHIFSFCTKIIHIYTFYTCSYFMLMLSAAAARRTRFKADVSYHF